MSEKIRVDLIVNVGSSCRTARNLQNNSLRYVSSPLDWMCDYSLETVLALFQSGFENFFANKERVPGRYYSHQHVRDADTGMVSLHHFPHGVDIDAFYEAKFRPAMRKKFRTLDRLMKKSGRVLLLCNRDEERDLAVDFLLRFSRLYRCEFTMLNIRNTYPETGHLVNRYELSGGRMLVEHHFCDVHPRSGHEFDNSEWWTGNAEKWAEVLSTVRYSKAALLRFALLRMGGRAARMARRAGEMLGPQRAARVFSRTGPE